MNKLLSITFLICIFLGLSLIGCASRVQMTVMKPGEVNLRNTKTIAVSSMVYKNPVKSNQLISKLTMGLLQTGYFDKVLDRQNLSLIEKEINLSLMNMSDEDVALSLGRFVGSSNLIAGSVEDNYSETNRESKYTDSKGIAYTTYYRDGIMRVSIHFKVINTETSELLAAKTFTVEKKQTTSANNARPPSPNKELLWTNATEEIIEKFLTYIAPHKVVESVKLENDKALPDNKSIANLLNIGATNEALEILYDAAALEYPKTDIKAKALYNYGIVMAILGNHETASIYLKEALKLKPTKQLYSDGITYAKQRAYEASKLEQQMKL
ncbi:MAG: hypothetical protein GX220_03970 [Treponema sp.]|nr:hypothetical protein [Treponema sp.]